MFLEPGLIESGIIDPIIRLGWNSPWELLLANADLGNSGVSFFGSTFDGYFEDEAKILANLIQHRASGNSFVSFEPSDCIIGAGETKRYASIILPAFKKVNENQLLCLVRYI